MTFQSPMLASASTGASNRQPVNFDLLTPDLWAVEVKLDGIRAYAMTDPSGVLSLWNRNGVEITGKFPELHDHPLHPNMWLDGEIVAVDGSFETVLTREKQEYGPRIMQLSKSNPCLFVAFDAPSDAQASYTARRELLETTVEGWRDYAYWQLVPAGAGEDFVQEVLRLKFEGVIYKRRGSRYQFGKRSRDWIKRKNVSRVSCLVAGYTLGTGSRAHFGALHVTLLDSDGCPVSVGKVGTGFTEADISELRARLDRGEVVIAEVETLGVTSGGSLRMPVFRGVRSDLSPHECTTRQLDTLLRS